MNFPQEILLQIFREACTDDGATARSLSLVSRHIYQVSLEVRFHSVAITGPAQLRAFAQALEDHPAALRKVGHLFVDYQHGKQGVSATTCENSSAIQRRYAQTPAPDFWECDYISSAALTRILQLASSTLRSLHLVSEAPRTTVLPPVSLPAATSITVRGPIHVYQRRKALAQFPSLQQLSISSFHEYPGNMLEDISAQAPLLSKVTFAPENPSYIFTTDLSRALSTQDAPQNTQPLLPSQCQVEVHIGAEVSTQDIWATTIRNEMLKVLSCLAACSKRLGVKEKARQCGYREEKARWLQDKPSIVAY